MSGRQAIRSRPRRRSAGGQVLPIFALIGVVLFAATGLAIDAGMGYLTYNGAERAAAAAALAGVPYMPAGLPTGTNSTTSCAGTAGAAACAATARAGYANGGIVNGHAVVITVQRYPAGCGAVGNPCADNKLHVLVQAYVQPTFLHILGFSDHPVVATDTGFFLPPISLGQPGAQLGSTIDQLGTSGSYYFLRSEGYGNDRIEGDAYDPYTTNTSFGCQQSTTITTAGLGTSTDVHMLSGSTDVTGGGGISALPTRGGYNFSIAVPSTIPGGTGSAQVYNPAFAPDGGFNPTAGNLYNMHEQDTSFSGNTYTDQYSAMEYTLFKVNDRFDHSTDVPLSQIVVDPLNVTISGGAVSSFVDVRYGKTLLPSGSTLTAFNGVMANIYHQWMDVGGVPNLASTQWAAGASNNVVHVIKSLASPLAGATPAATYRLRVDMLDYNGLRPGDDAGIGASPCSRAHKGYAVRLATSSNTLCTDANCQMSALDELAVYTPIITAGASGFSIPLFSLPADYAGQTINFYIYDVGDVSGANAISILNPDAPSCGGVGGCLFTTPTGVSVYDLGISRNTSLSGNLLYAPTNNHGGSADSCASPAVQPDGNQALINTYPIAGGCSGRGSTFFNGRWLLFQLQIPSTYAGGGGNYWQMHYSLTSGTASDTFTIAVNYANSPVHLL